jgi:hypothetical protein
MLLTSPQVHARRGIGDAVGRLPAFTDAGLGLGIMSVVSAMHSGSRGENGAGHRRVRWVVAIPVVVGCALLGTVAGLLFPLPPAALTREGPALLSVGHEPMPEDQGSAAGPKLTTTPHSRHEGVPRASASPTDEPAQSASTRQGQARSELTQDAAPRVVSEKPDAIEMPRRATSRVGEGRHRAKHRNLLSDRMRQRREQSAWSQLPFLGPVAGALLP